MHVQHVMIQPRSVISTSKRVPQNGHQKGPKVVPSKVCQNPQSGVFLDPRLFVQQEDPLKMDTKPILHISPLPAPDLGPNLDHLWNT